jgi:signal transduction histidine kinase
MFKRISRSLALQFTGFVFLLFLINGAIFLAADVSNARRQTSFRMTREAQLVLSHVSPTLSVDDRDVPQRLRGLFRVVDVGGNTVYGNGELTHLPFPSSQGFSAITIQDDQYNVLTTPVLSGGEVRGFVQLVDPQHAELTDLPLRGLLFILVSVLISGLAFIIGLFFAKRSLKPAEEMFQRLEQFTQDASHELRTPLAVLGSSLDVALKTKNYQEGIVSAKEDLHHISRLVERLLELTRLDQFTLEAKPIDLSSLVTEMVEKYRLIAKEQSVTIIPEIEDGCAITGDAPLLKQVVGNLLSNAIKFNHARGTVTVRLKKNTLTISDTGIGIAPNALSNIFHRFFRADTSRSTDGLGLGLALVKRILNLHGFGISVESTEGKGTTFTVTFQRS